MNPMKARIMIPPTLPTTLPIIVPTGTGRGGGAPAMFVAIGVGVDVGVVDPVVGLASKKLNNRVAHYMRTILEKESSRLTTPNDRINQNKKDTQSWKQR